MEVLDDPIWTALSGAQAHLGQRRGDAARYAPEVSPLAALRRPDQRALADLAELTPPGGFALVALEAVETPGWQRAGSLTLTQMVCTEAAALEPPSVSLTALARADVPEMLELAERTQPGPFAERTIEFGGYLGVRDAGRLVAMAGERMRPPGFAEVSGVCTDPVARGRGLAAALVAEVCRRIRARGETPFLHVMADSPTEATARGIYERLGFRVRRRIDAVALMRK